MARTRLTEAIRKKDAVLEPPRKQIKLKENQCLTARATTSKSTHMTKRQGKEIEESSSDSDNQPLVKFVKEPIQCNGEYGKAMESVIIEPCVTMDYNTLDLLNIKSDVIWYLKKLGLSKLFKIECKEYTELTRDFLSTVTLAFPNNDEDQPAGNGILFFKIGNQNGRISIATLCKLFNFANETSHDFKENHLTRDADFSNWTHFADAPFIGSRSKVSHITHPAIRYVHRLITTTLQCKLESNKVTTDEFYILTTPFFSHKQHANLGLLFAKTLVNVKHLAQQTDNKKVIVRFGRLITAIVNHCKIDISAYTPSHDNAPLDLKALQHIQFLNGWTKNPTQFCYVCPIGSSKTALVQLPCDDVPPLSTGVVSFSPPPERYFIETPAAPKYQIHQYYAKQRTIKARRPIRNINAMTASQAANKALDRLGHLERTVQCQSRFISRLIRVVRHIAPDRLFRPSVSTHEPDLGEFSLASALGSDEDSTDEEESATSHYTST